MWCCWWSLRRTKRVFPPFWCVSSSIALLYPWWDKRIVCSSKTHKKVKKSSTHKLATTPSKESGLPERLRFIECSFSLRSEYLIYDYKILYTSYIKIPDFPKSNGWSSNGLKSFKVIKEEATERMCSTDLILTERSVLFYLELL